MIKKIIITNIFLYCSYKLIKNIYNASRSLDDFNIPINNLKYNSTLPESLYDNYC